MSSQANTKKSHDSPQKSEPGLHDPKIQSQSEMDSGFMSGSNLLSSSSLYSEESVLLTPYDNNKDPSSVVEAAADPTTIGGPTEQDKSCIPGGTIEFLDSGIDLSERISSLNLTCSGPIPENEPILLNCPATKQPESRSKLEQMGLSPVHITILKEIFKKDDDGDTQLHVAVMRGFFEVVWHVTRILPHQALLDIPNNSGRTALHLAVASGNFSLARHLLVCGSSPVARNQKGDTPLHVACRNGDQEMVSSLTSQITSLEVVQARLSYPCNHTPGLLAADLNNYDGQTCIHIAAQGGHQEILKHLTWYGADINAKECKCGRTALHFAVASRNAELVRFLSETCRAVLSIQTYAGLTPYQLAVANDAPTLATLLEELGAQKETLPNTYADEDFEYEDDPVNFGDFDSWGPVNDIQLGGVSFPFANSSAAVGIPVSTHGGPFDADQYL